MPCRKIREIVDGYLDNEPTTDTEREFMLAHTQTCAQCRLYFEQAEKLRALVRSTSTATLPPNFRNTLIARLQTEAVEEPGKRTLFGWLVPAGWHRPIPQVAVALGMLMLIVGIWFGRAMLPGSTPDAIDIAQVLQIDVVSPYEDAVVEPNGFDVSAAFYSLGEPSTLDYRVRILLDAQDVTDATEVNADYVIYTPEPLEPGHHLATIQLLDASGMPAIQRSWAFYVLPSL